MISFVTRTKEINFLPADLIEERQRKKRLLLAVPGIVLVVFALAVVMYYPQYMQKQIQNEIDGMQEQISVMAPVKVFAERRDSEKGQFDKYNTAVSSLEQKKTSAVMLIDGISSVLPPGVYITQMNIINSWGVKISIKVDNALDMARLITGLRSLGWFETVEPTQVPLRGSTGIIQMDLPFKGVGGVAPTSPANNSNADLNTNDSSAPALDSTGAAGTDATTPAPLDVESTLPVQPDTGSSVQGGE
ncbi:MAG: PilN domain-containing protein [Acidobacteriota bacterium]